VNPFCTQFIHTQAGMCGLILVEVLRQTPGVL
jgi:hypothetical protein